MDEAVFTGDKPLPEVNGQIDAPAHDNGKINKEFYNKFIESILDQNKDYPPPVPLVNLVSGCDVVPILTDKSFSLWQGKQKTKKTIALVLMVAAYLREKLCTDDIYMEGIGEGIVLWFDTEQGESYAARTMKLILKLADLETSERLIYCDLRIYTPAERLQIIQAAIEATPDVKLIIIDGLVDLLTDLREPKEALALMTEILRLCSFYNLHIAGVLHQNKSPTDKNAREIVGTIASQKCEIEITSEVDAEDKARSIISTLNSRGLPFEPFAIRWDKGSLPCIEQDYKRINKKEVQNLRSYEMAKQVVDAVFKLNALKNKEAVEGIMQTEKVALATAERRLKSYIGWGFIEQGADGRYRKKV